MFITRRFVSINFNGSYYASKISISHVPHTLHRNFVKNSRSAFFRGKIIVEMFVHRGIFPSAGIRSNAKQPSSATCHSSYLDIVTHRLYLDCTSRSFRTYYCPCVLVNPERRRHPMSTNTDALMFISYSYEVLNRICGFLNQFYRKVFNSRIAHCSFSGGFKDTTSLNDESLLLIQS